MQVLLLPSCRKPSCSMSPSRWASPKKQPQSRPNPRQFNKLALKAVVFPSHENRMMVLSKLWAPRNLISISELGMTFSIHFSLRKNPPPNSSPISCKKSKIRLRLRLALATLIQAPLTAPPPTQMLWTSTTVVRVTSRQRTRLVNRRQRIS